MVKASTHIKLLTFAFCQIIIAVGTTFFFNQKGIHIFSFLHKNVHVFCLYSVEE